MIAPKIGNKKEQLGLLSIFENYIYFITTELKLTNLSSVRNCVFYIPKVFHRFISLVAHILLICHLKKTENMGRRKYALKLKSNAGAVVNEKEG